MAFYIRNIERLLRGQEKGMEEVTEGHHFVLVHGAGHGAWCWFKLRCLLEASGHRVSCPDLASAGIHPADPNSILSIDEYDAPLFSIMSALPEHEKVTPPPSHAHQSLFPFKQLLLQETVTCKPKMDR